MIQEDYVSFEISKLLKDKGFDYYCRAVYEEGNTKIKITDEYWRNTDSDTREIDDEYNDSFSFVFITAPTLQMVLKWLREVHHYYIQVMLDSWALGYHAGYYVVIQKTDSDFEMMLQDAVDEIFYQTYEEACEAAIKYCLTNLV